MTVIKYYINYCFLFDPLFLASTHYLATISLMPMTFEILGEGLRLFEGRELRDLANFRKHCRDNIVSCFKSFLNIEEPQSNIWTSCSTYTRKPHKDSYSLSKLPMSTTNRSLPSWLAELYQKHIDELQVVLPWLGSARLRLASGGSALIWLASRAEPIIMAGLPMTWLGSWLSHG
jgi:hypothetical protein